MTDREIKNLNECIYKAIDSFNKVIENEYYTKDTKSSRTSCSYSLEAISKAILIIIGDYNSGNGINLSSVIERFYNQGIINDKLRRMFDHVRLARNSDGGHFNLNEEKNYRDDDYEIVLETNVIMDWAPCFFDKAFYQPESVIGEHEIHYQKSLKMLEEYRKRRIVSIVSDIEVKHVIRYSEATSVELLRQKYRYYNKSDYKPPHNNHENQYETKNSFLDVIFTVKGVVSAIVSIVVIYLVISFAITFIKMWNEEPMNLSQQVGFSMENITDRETIDTINDMNPISIASSSVSADEEYQGKDGDSFKATNLIDGDNTTSWKCEEKANKTYSTVKIINIQNYHPQYIVFCNGDQKSKKSFKKYARVNNVIVRCGNCSYTIRLKDTMNDQYFKLSGIENEDELDFEIKSIYPGEKNRIVSLGEIKIY